MKTKFLLFNLFLLFSPSAQASEGPNMESDSIRGEWRLVASDSLTSEIKFINEEPDPNGVSEWLNGVDNSLAASAKPTSGMTLSIAADGTFTERVSGKPNVYWFDEEGVLADVTPFDGLVVQNEQGSFLRPINIAKWAIPVDGRYGMAVLRYDDGDTKITDRVHPSEGRLIRTINVVTDELYLDRVVIVYERAN